MKTDFIIVGLGIGGLAMAEVLWREGRSFILISKLHPSATNVAGAVYNPLVLKRFTKVWNANEQLPLLGKFYSGIEKRLGIRVIQTIGIWRRLASVEEQNKWKELAQHSDLGVYMASGLHPNTHSSVSAPFGYGEVMQGGRIIVENLLGAYLTFLREKGLFLEEQFSHAELRINEDGLHYKDIAAKKIIFCEGVGLSTNPYFNYLPLVKSKGELLEIEAPDWKIPFLLKASVFILPLEANRYWVGATYDNKDSSWEPTDTASRYLLDRLNSFIRKPYKVIGQKCGVRPTVIDRRPLLGRHPIHKELFLLNGLGSRGTMVAPWAAQRLFDLIENDMPLPKEADLNRFSYPFEK